MKAVVRDRYGSPDVLRVEEVPVPSPAAGQVRVEVAATSVNLSDWEGLRGLRAGDEVYGDNLALMGGFAEYALAPESALAHIDPDVLDRRGRRRARSRG